MKRTFAALLSAATLLGFSLVATSASAASTSHILDIDSEGQILDIDSDGQILDIDSEGQILDIDSHQRILDID